MKTLFHINDDMWLDLSRITGVAKVEDGYRLLLGDSGVQFPETMSPEQIRSVLRAADIAIMGFDMESNRVQK